MLKQTIGFTISSHNHGEGTSIDSSDCENRWIVCSSSHEGAVVHTVPAGGAGGGRGGGRGPPRQHRDPHRRQLAAGGRAAGSCAGAAGRGAARRGVHDRCWSQCPDTRRSMYVKVGRMRVADTTPTSGDMTTPRRRGARGPPAWQQGGASMPSPPSNITTTVPERGCRFVFVFI